MSDSTTAPPPLDEARSQDTRVIVTAIDMPFWSMANLMIKWGLAAIPAAIMLGAIIAFASIVFGGLIAALRSYL
jgi:hypothetical protein